MLQTPNQKSKPRDHSKYLTTRLARWKEGQLPSLMDETNEIQRRLKAKMKSNNTKKEDEQSQKAFVKLMLLGKIGDAAKKVNNEDSVKGVHQLNDEIKKILQEKHPEGRSSIPDVLLPQTSTARRASHIRGSNR